MIRIMMNWNSRSNNMLIIFNIKFNQAIVAENEISPQFSSVYAFNFTFSLISHCFIAIISLLLWLHINVIRLIVCDELEKHLFVWDLSRTREEKRVFVFCWIKRVKKKKNYRFSLTRFHIHRDFPQIFFILMMFII